MSEPEDTITRDYIQALIARIAYFSNLVDELHDKLREAEFERDQLREELNRETTSRA